MVKRFDVWVTRDHASDYGGCDFIEVSSVLSTTVTRNEGCCVFSRQGYGNTKCLEDHECLERFNFLPRPGQCVNVWNDSRGNIQYREHPILDEELSTLYKKVTVPGERKHYI